MLEQVISDARARAVSALNRANGQVDQAIRLQSLPDVDLALARFFNGNQALLVFLRDRIQRVQRVIGAVEFHPIMTTDPLRPVAVQNLADRAARTGVPAYADPTNNRVVLLANWFDADKAPVRPGILIHEVFHFAFNDIRGHDPALPKTNAHAYQGFVCALSGLPAPVPNRMFPPRRP